MEANEYQNEIRKYSNYPQEVGPFTVILTLQNNVGKLSAKLNKVLVNDHGAFNKEDKVKVMISLGDIINDVTNIASDIGFTLDDVLSLNITKYANSKESNAVQNKS